MKRFFFFLLFLNFYCLGFTQNLIPNPSAEDYIECPEHLGGWPEDGNGIDRYAPPWESYRGTPDYFNNCSESPFLGWNNSLGYQEPRTGEGYLGLVTFTKNLSNAREYLGISLETPLTIGLEYYLSFYVSRAHQFNSFNLASNNIGALLMTNNYLNSAELGPSPNFSSYHVESIIVDTINWVNISYQFVADSAYQYLAFGNFFENDLTDTLRIGGEPDGNVTSYYYFDDFCLSLNPNECDVVNSTKELDAEIISIWPNPSYHAVNIEASIPIQEVSIYNIQGEVVLNEKIKRNESVNIQLKNLQSGMYIAFIKTEKGIFKKRFVVSH